MAEPEPHLFDESEDDETKGGGEADPEEIELSDIEKDSASSLQVRFDIAMLVLNGLTL